MNFTPISVKQKTEEDIKKEVIDRRRAVLNKYNSNS
jgi:hypothetical protein